MKKNIIKIVVLVLMVGVLASCFTACVPTDYNEAKEVLEAAGYVTYVEIDEDTPIILATVYTTDPESDDFVYVWYFKDAKSARAKYRYYKTNNEYMLQLYESKYAVGELTKEEYDRAIEEVKSAKYSRSGKVVVYGCGAPYETITK